MHHICLFQKPFDNIVNILGPTFRQSSLKGVPESPRHNQGENYTLYVLIYDNAHCIEKIIISRSVGILIILFIRGID